MKHTVTVSPQLLTYICSVWFVVVDVVSDFLILINAWNMVFTHGNVIENTWSTTGQHVQHSSTDWWFLISLLALVIGVNDR